MNAEQLNTLQLLSTAKMVFETVEPSMSRTFMTLGREHLTPNFSARGIYADHKINSYTYFEEHFTNPESEFNAINIHGVDKVDAYLKALNDIIVADSKLMDIIERGVNANPVKKQVDEALEEIAKDSQPVQTPAEAVKQVKQQAAAAMPEVSAAQQSVQKVTDKKTEAPGYGLQIDMDSVFTNAATSFLLSQQAGILSHVTNIVKNGALQNTLVVLGAGKEANKVIIQGRLHKDFKEVLEVTSIEGQSFLSGPAGTGKTTLGAQVAEALQLTFAHISCTAGMSEAHLLGRMIADGTYISSNFVELFENGGVFLADEVDAADANTLLILNSALANGYISVPNRAGKPTAKRHKDFYMICAANTFGNGSAEYSGREILDAAFLDRFVGSKVFVDYDTELEEIICSDYMHIARKIWKIRENVKQSRLKRVVSTRAFVSAVKSMKAGRKEEQFFDRFFTGWSNEEIKKALSV